MSPSKHEALHISQAIKEMLDKQQLTPKFDEASVVASWEKLMGKVIARRTKRVYVRDRVLFVELASPSFRQEMLYHKAQILEVLHKEFGREVVKDVVLM